jgi:hypothetical protein
MHRLCRYMCNGYFQYVFEGETVFKIISRYTQRKFVQTNNLVAHTNVTHLNTLHGLIILHPCAQHEI